MSETTRADLQEEFIRLRARGWSYRRIAKKLKLSTTTLTGWGRSFDREIASLRAIELEALQESYYMAKEARIRTLGEQLRAVRDELGRRDLSQVPTERLLELLLKIWNELKGEYVETRPLEQQALKNRGDTQMDAAQAARQLQELLERFRAGQVDQEAVRQEIAILQSLIRAYEAARLETKLDRIEAALEGRRLAANGGSGART